MTNAYVLMTAMPPTKGHINLIRFASELNVKNVHVLVCTAPGEPFATKRVSAVREEVKNIPNVLVWHWHRNQPQDPAAPGFWEMWDDIMRLHHFKPGDIVVSSELYGATLAKRLDGIFMPYDPGRELYYTKATNIRDNLGKYFHDIAPAFQPNLLTTVTIFGAESTGKTTLSKELAWTINGHWLFEWARPYLESVGPDIHIDSMKAIWAGQLATQRHARYMKDKPFIIQDTDLYSTIGYWEQPHWRKSLGNVPIQLCADAYNTKSDLYIITKSNIPFERDVIRYGGDKRESPDEYWIDIAEKFGLNYVVLDSANAIERVAWATKYAREVLDAKAASIYYDRMGL